MEEEEEYEEEEVLDFEGRLKKVTTLPQLLYELQHHETNFQSPININMSNMKEILLPELEWHHYEVPPKKVKLTNNGNTIILSAKWYQERPYLIGGPLLGNYVFSQLHFHWGANDMEGSEHTVDGTQYPVEMHVVHFKSAYLTQETALYEKDGVIVLVYFFKLQSQVNSTFQSLLDYFNEVSKSFTSMKAEVIPINRYIRPFSNDYFMYWGNIKTTTNSHLILWIICREPIGISAEQVELFRNLYDGNDELLIRNFRTVEPAVKAVYHINPSDTKYSTLLPIPREAQTPKSRHKRRGTQEDKS